MAVSARFGTSWMRTSHFKADCLIKGARAWIWLSKHIVGRMVSKRNVTLGGPDNADHRFGMFEEKHETKLGLYRGVWKGRNVGACLV